MLIQSPVHPRPWPLGPMREGILSARCALDELLGFPMLKRKAAKRLGYTPNLDDPQTYNEKITWRKAYDRNPLFPKISDKITVRDFIRDQLGDAVAQTVLSELYAHSPDPRSLDFTNLPAEYAVKANHGCGWNVLVREDDPVDLDRLQYEMAHWMQRSHGRTKHEWAYQPIKRQVMIEELITDANGKIADDIKFAVFDGKCEFIVYCDDRFGDYAFHHLTPTWERLLISSGDEQRPLPPKPALFDQMLKIAEDVTKGFDFFRVDFLFTETRHVLNEITLYDASGMDPLDPPIWDNRFGEFWTLPNR